MLDATRLSNGSYGKIYRDGVLQSGVTECVMEVEDDIKEINVCGEEWTHYKSGNKKGSGSISGFKITSEMIQNGFRPFELITALEDPEAYGHERIRYKNVRPTKLQLANIKANEVIEEATDVVFTGYELLDPIEAY